MQICSKKSVPLIIAIILSIMLHAVIIAGISGVKGFKFTGSLSKSIQITSIIKETPHKHSIQIKPTDSYLQENPSENIKNTPDNIPSREGLVLETPNSASDMETITASKNKTEPFNNIENDNSELSNVSTPHAKIDNNTSDKLKTAKERLSFDIYWLGVYVGKAVLEAVNDNGNVKITSQVHSAPVISAFYKVEDYAETRVTNGTPTFFKIKQRTGRKRSDKETFFDINNKKVTHINHIKGTKDEHTINTDILWDVMSGFYYLRTQNLNVGETVYINIFDSNKFYQAEVQGLRREKIRLSDDTEIDSVVVKPILKSEGLFQNKGDISIWLTDDEIKMPVRVETEVPIGRVVAELKEVKADY